MCTLTKFMTLHKKYTFPTIYIHWIFKVCLWQKMCNLQQTMQLGAFHKRSKSRRKIRLGSNGSCADASAAAGFCFRVISQGDSLTHTKFLQVNQPVSYADDISYLAFRPFCFLVGFFAFCCWRIYRRTHGSAAKIKTHKYHTTHTHREFRNCTAGWDFSKFLIYFFVFTLLNTL